jgi:outer membrane protein assembly factor BamB
VPDERRRRLTLALLVLFSLVGVLVAVWLDSSEDGGGGTAAPAADRDRTTSSGDDDDRDDGDDEESSGFESDYDGLVDPASFGKPYPNAKVAGLLTFRGNPTRSYHGRGPVPSAPTILYRFPEVDPMCRTSTNLGETKVWCGMGWTGQPVLFERGGRTWAVFGGYDGHVHFMDVATGQRILPDLETGDIIKGTPTVDPDGFPLVYSGSRDNYFRVIAIDRPEPTELWKLHANDIGPVMWNDDWDSSPIVVGDHLFIGGENSRFVAVKLNRGKGADGKVTVAPEVVWHTAAWDDELLAALAGASQPKAMSVESSPAISGNVVYFANSGGLVQGWDVGGLAKGVAPKRVFRYWTGDDTDATVVVDEQGFLYVASEYERGLQRARDSGQLMKLDPKRAANPLVWKVDDLAGGGIWATPAVWKDVVYVGTNGGRVLGVDRATGAIRWEKRVTGPAWGSPVVVDDVLILGDCDGILHAWDVSDTTVDPPERWAVNLGGCIEATPAVWKGRVYIGSRNGHLYALGDPATTSSSG